MSNAIARFFLKRQMNSWKKDKRLLRSIFKATALDKKKISDNLKNRRAYSAKAYKAYSDERVIRKSQGQKKPTAREKILKKRMEKMKKEEAKAKKDMKNLRNIQKQTYRTSRTIRKAAPWAAGGVGLAAANRWRKRRRKRDRKGRFRRT